MTVPTNPTDRLSSTPTRLPATDVEHDDEGCTTCIHTHPRSPARYSHDDLLDAFQRGLLFGENAVVRSAPGYAEGWADAVTAWTKHEHAVELLRIREENAAG